MASNPSESYGAFAYAYDQALGDRYFRAVRRRIDAVLQRFPPAARTHLDVACGTGLAMRYFERLGFVSTGVDLSTAMLDVARSRARRLVQGDARMLPFRGSFGYITCLYDSLNHMLDRGDLVAIFREVRRVADEHSLFVFDMNHPEIYPAVWGMKEPFVDEGPDFHLEIATTYSRSDRLGTALVTGWRMLPGGERVAIRERHRQRAYDEREIVAALVEAGFVPVDVQVFDPYGEARPVKLFCVCRPG